MQPEIIHATEELYRANPDGARAAPAVTGRLVEGKAELSAGPYTWHADLAPSLGGTVRRRARRTTCSARWPGVPSPSSTTRWRRSWASRSRT